MGSLFSCKQRFCISERFCLPTFCCQPLAFAGMIGIFTNQVIIFFW